jgi:hypothetical protein
MPPNSDLCIEHPEAAACIKDPAVTSPGVVTILFTMSQIPQSAGSLILANAIKYASPIASPKILFVKDSQTGGEDEGDPDYIKNTLLKGYNVTYSIIVSGGLSASSTKGYDLVIVSNPGHPLSDAKTMETLLAFKGGVILIGDDMSNGVGFRPNALTGLNITSNGTEVSCNGKTYSYDNLGGYNYQVTMEDKFFAGIPAKDKTYEYGNDIDHTTIAAGVEVLAWAKADPTTCDIGKIPAVVRRPK